MGSIKNTIQIDIISGNPFEAKSKMQSLKALAQLDTEALGKLAELGKNPSAVQQLKSKFEMIKGFLK